MIGGEWEEEIAHYSPAKCFFLSIALNRCEVAGLGLTRVS
jgi:hypothetical protein